MFYTTYSFLITLSVLCIVYNINSNSNNDNFTKRIVSPKEYIFNRWNNCDERSVPDRYIVGSFSKVIIEYLNHDEWFNKTTGANYSSTLSHVLHDNKYNDYEVTELTLPSIKGNCYLFTTNPNNYTIDINKSFEYTYRPNKKDSIAIIGLLVFLISMFSLIE